MKTAAVEQKMKPVALVVDDNWLTQALVRRELEKRGFAVFEARTAADAVRGYERRQPAVVTVDLDRVDGRGQEIAEALVTAAPKANIVAITSEVLPAFRNHLLDIGIKGIVIKPYDDPQSVASAVQATFENGLSTSIPQTMPLASRQSQRWRKHLESGVIATAREILLTIGGPELQVLPPGLNRSAGAAFLTSSDVRGAWEGTIHIRFDKKLANKLTARLFGEDARRLKRGQIQDALIEITNMIVGNLKSSLPGTNRDCILHARCASLMAWRSGATSKPAHSRVLEDSSARLPFWRDCSHSSSRWLGW